MFHTCWYSHLLLLLCCGTARSSFFQIFSSSFILCWDSTHLCRIIAGSRSSCGLNACMRLCEHVIISVCRFVCKCVCTHAYLIRTDFYKHAQCSLTHSYLPQREVMRISHTHIHTHPCTHLVIFLSVSRLTNTQRGVLRSSSHWFLIISEQCGPLNAPPPLPLSPPAGVWAARGRGTDLDFLSASTHLRPAPPASSSPRCSSSSPLILLICFNSSFLHDGFNDTSTASLLPLPVMVIKVSYYRFKEKWLIMPLLFYISAHVRFTCRRLSIRQWRSC